MRLMTSGQGGLRNTAGGLDMVVAAQGLPAPGVGSGLTGLRCRQPERPPCTLLSCPEPGALTCVVYFLCSSEGTDARQGCRPSALSHPVQGLSPHGSPELRGQSLQFKNWEQHKSNSNL